MKHARDIQPWGREVYRDRTMSNVRPDGKHRADNSRADLTAEWTNPEHYAVETRRRVHTFMPRTGKVLDQLARFGY